MSMFDDEPCKICGKEKSTVEQILALIKPRNPEFPYTCAQCIENLLEGINKLMIKGDEK